MPYLLTDKDIKHFLKFFHANQVENRVINKLPTELIKYLQTFLDDSTLKTLSSVNHSFFKNSQSEKILRKINFIEKSISRLMDKLDIIKKTLSGQLEYQGNFLYHFVLDDVQGFSQEDEIIRQVVRLTKDFADLRLEIVKTNLYVSNLFPIDDLIAKKWGQLIGNFSALLPSNALTPEELFIKADNIPKQPAASLMLYLGSRYRQLNNNVRELQGIYIAFDTHTPSTILRIKAPDGETIPQFFGSPPVATKKNHLKALKSPIPSFLKLPKDESQSLEYLLNILNLIKANKAYRNHIQILWDIADTVPANPLINILAHYYTQQHPREDPRELDSIINFINYLIDNYPHLKLIDNYEEGPRFSCNLL